MSSTSEGAAVQRTTDVIVIGDGIIGLSTALELARRGARCVVFGTERSGIASFAAAGLLAPSIGQLPPVALAFFEASLGLYPALLASLADFDDELALLTGLLVVSDSPGAADVGRGGVRLSAEEARQVEPNVRAPFGGAIYSRDGAVDNVRLMGALRRAVTRRPEIELREHAAVASLEIGRGSVTVTTGAGTRAAARRVILAAGAWTPQIRGLPRSVPVFPLKGQMLALDACPLTRPVVGNGVYLVPRGKETVVGSTSERAGFDVSTTPDAIAGLCSRAAATCPALASPAARPGRVWAGIRPATPDMLPIIGPDPDYSELLYATGHSRNGILLAPATAMAMADLALDDRTDFGLTGFGIARFESMSGDTNLIDQV